MSSYPYLYANLFLYAVFSLVLPVLALLVIVAGGLALYFLFVRKSPTPIKGRPPSCMIFLRSAPFSPKS